MKMSLTALVLVATLFFKLAYAQITETKLISSDGAVEDNFGWSVSISGTYAIVGADGDDDNAFNSGSAFVFKRDGVNWTEEAKLTASDGALNDFFGGSVSMSGDYAIVGASEDDDNGEVSGSAYVFKRNGVSWAEEAKLTASDGAFLDRFGSSVCISGDYAIVGAVGDDNGSGSAYLFKRDGVSWTEEAKLTASDGAANDFFGQEVSISGDYAIVGANQDDDNGGGSGSAYVFRRDGTTWVEEAKLTSSDGAANDEFGVSVSISGDYAAIGARGDDDNGDGSGSAYVFRREGTTWVEEAKLTASDGAPFDDYGSSVSISGDYTVVGAFGDDDNGDASGSAYIYRREGTTWVEVGKLTASDGAAFDVYAFSVSISGGHIVVGSNGDDDNGFASGSAYVYSDFIVGVEELISGIPANFTLKQNYPNPFNPSTTVEFSLPQASDVTLKVYNILGQEVATLAEELQDAGVYRTTFDASGLSSGVYIYRFQARPTEGGRAGEFVDAKKLLLLR